MSQPRSASMFGSRESSSGCVLVVEDKPGVRNAVRLALEDAGYDVLEAEDVEKGMKTISTGENPLVVDAVITDIDMNKGMEAVAYFKKHCPRVSLVVMTGLPDRQEENPQRIKIVILGAGKGGAALLDMFSHLPGVEIVGITDKDPSAPGLKRARELNIPVVEDAVSLVTREGTSLIVDVTGNPRMGQLIAEHQRPGTEILGGAAAKLLWTLVQHEAQIQKQLLQSEKLTGIIQEGITDYLVRPIVREKLLDAVSKAMEKREINRL